MDMEAVLSPPPQGRQKLWILESTLKVSAMPQQSEICVKFSVFHAVFGVRIW